ncbi:pentatricopeptide repeat-containing protein At1g71460, chloroplastic [Mercurialis annua]|uniref:pentatricopeptide repeat-containing protein At1g71460, chloroplastic n=1 Tax=Mercurialis annua TaxID=3986 RepID=UPI00215F1A0E|nr:pentatricopeptide repeat-containing protein At1g71460, chloroplastic [Mercurialis annua]
MESVKSSPCLYFPLNFHALPPNPFRNNTSEQFFKFKSYANNNQTRYPTKHFTRTSFPRRRNKKKKFQEKDAFPSSLPLHTKNPVAIYKDIKTFARENKLDKALIIMDYLEHEGIPVNATTFSALIAACIRSKSLTQAKQIHTHVRINGLENNEFLRTKLVSMYTSCGSVEDAQRVFDECSSSGISVYPWNALLRGTVIYGSKGYNDVVSAYNKMRELGVDLNVYSFSSVIKSFAGASALKQGLKTHALLVKNGFGDNSILKTSLIDFYFKCGKIRLAYKVFEEMPDRDVDIVVWGAMIAGFAHNRRQWEALDYLRWMVSEGIYPNSVILTSVLPVVGEVWARKLGQEVHGYVLKTKRYSNQLTIQCGLIDMYCKCGDMDSSRRVFYGSMERNAITWTALMSGYASNGRLEQALRSVAWMQQEGFRPDVVTAATIIPVCGELKALKHGKEIHAYAVKNLFFPNVSVTTSLIKMYSKCRVLENSVNLFDTMENRNVISWTAMIDSYVENGCIDGALHVFRSMQFSKHRPDSVLTGRMLSICSKIKALKLGKEIHGHTLKKNFESVPFVSSEIVKMYGKCGLIDCANSVFNAIPVKGSMAWTAIIEAYGCNNLWQDAIHLFREMIAGDFTPTHFTFKVVLSICDQAGFADDACRIFELMTRRYKINATEEHYSIIIGLLSRSDRIAEAEKFLRMSSSLT